MRCDKCAFFVIIYNQPLAERRRRSCLTATNNFRLKMIIELLLIANAHSLTECGSAYSTKVSVGNDNDFGDFDKNSFYFLLLKCHRRRENVKVKWYRIPGLGRVSSRRNACIISGKVNLFFLTSLFFFSLFTKSSGVASSAGFSAVSFHLVEYINIEGIFLCLQTVDPNKNKKQMRNSPMPT